MEDDDLDPFTDIKTLKSDIEMKPISMVPPDNYKIPNTANITLPPSYSLDDNIIKYKYERLTDNTLLYMYYESHDALQMKLYSDNKDLKLKLIERRDLSIFHLNKLGYKLHSKLGLFILYLGDIVPDDKMKDIVVFDRIKWEKTTLNIKIDSEFVKGLQ
ncbi:hypothetical protein CDIK_2272 [Cucumispora dikerogammari]|nr:hypothetical protein CDIK_2272 [Cucumispora dikerogammari]